MHTLELADYSVWLPDGTPLLQHIHHRFAGRTGLVGANGAGKTTLLEGLARAPAPFRVAYLRQAQLEDTAGTLAEALGVARPWAAARRVAEGTAGAGDYAALEGAWDIEARVAAVFDRLALGIPQEPAWPLARLSGGEQVRVRLAAVLLADARFVLLDEPTNHLDAAGRAFVHAFVRTWPYGLVAATHDRALLAHVDTVVRLDGGALQVYGGNYAAFQAARAREREAAAAAVTAARERLQAAEAGAREAAARQAKRQSRGRKSYLENGGMPRILAGLKKRNAEKTAAKLAGVHDARVALARGRLAQARERAGDEVAVKVDAPAAENTGRRLVAARGLRLALPGGRPLWREPLALAVAAGDRLALAGNNGVGKTSLLLALLGRFGGEVRGELRVAARRVAYLGQQAEGLDLAASVFANARRGAPRAAEHDLRIRLARLGFPGEAAFKRAGVLSGGERVRAALACLLGADEPPELLLLDEPDNHLDLPAKEAVAAALRAYTGAVIVVSHDPDFLADAGIREELRVASSRSSVDGSR
jgi:ATPase subunit of ABC transporter with duplicated ATPase domains